MTYFNKQTMLYTLLILTFIACKREQQPNLTGSVLASDEVIISEIRPDQLVALDTIAIEDGVFRYSLPVEGPVFLLMEFTTGSRVPVLIQADDEITLTINDTVPFGTFDVQGSASVAKMARQRKLLVETANFFDSINYVNALYADSSNFHEVRQQLNDALRDRLDKHRIALQEIIDEDTSDLSNIMAFYQSLARIEFFDVERDIAYYKKVDNGLQSAYPENEHAQYFHEKLVDYEKALQRQKEVALAAENVTVGSIAPNITLPNPDGEELNLSDLRGKVVLIDFWASWCGPCRRANPYLVELYDQYNSKGFEIFSVSLDGVPQQANAMNDWRFAIESDSLTWPNHVSDLKGYESEVVTLYGFEGIPFTVLVDESGTIIAKNLRGQALGDKLAEVL
jgi:thiol-disulfide isomerase/thioredoxin